MKKFLLYILLITTLQIFATHNRAGEITYRHISGTTYEVTITTYTKIGPNVYADRDELEIQWGDGQSDILPRVSKVDFGTYRHNRYVGRHTYAGPGEYELVMQDPNRNQGVENIPESVNVVFAIKTKLKISATEGNNSTPVLLNKPLDFAAKGHIFIHNPAAYDPDGDSLSYKLTTCLGYDGEPIPNYTLPQAAHSITVNPYTGDLIWDYPIQVGIYNVAMYIEEWRNGVKLGQVLRDMQIEVKETDNNPPVLSDIQDTCIMATDTLRFDVIATDSEDNFLSLTATGIDQETIDETGNPKFGNTVSHNKYIKKTFEWLPTCDDIRKQPYNVVFKAEDNNTDVNLVDIKSVRIHVLAPPPVLDTLIPTNNSVKLEWTPSVCSNVDGYYIYRKTEYYDFQAGECETGVPEYTGFEKIATVEGNNIFSYIDNNNGLGLAQGYHYCYMITGFYKDGSESFASNELCTDLINGIPTITNVSVENTSETEGKIYLAWSKPIDFDTVTAPGPYKYLIYRSEGKWGQSFTLIDSLSDINDTIYYDSLLNTKENIYSYKVEFYNDETNNRFLIGAPHIASSTFLHLTGTDNTITLRWESNVPWRNTQYVIYRQNSSGIFDSLTTVTTDSFADINLANGIERCYKIKTIGHYQVSHFINPIVNYSQINCDAPIDSIPPCAPDLQLTSLCDSMYNQLIWTNPNHYCSDDVVAYNVYYSPTLDGEMTKIKSIFNPDDTTFIHRPELSIAGCYYVTAIDSFNNETRSPQKVCIDNCEYYKLPNIFTPNGDNQNDYFRPGPYKFVQKIDLKIFNRWGNVLFETTDPDIMWDGTVDGKPVPDGVYFYICDVYEYRLTGVVPRNIRGFVHIERGKENKKND